MRRLTPADNRPPALGNFVRFSQNPEQLGESGENSKSTCRFTRACYATVAKLIGAEGSPLKQRRACLLTKLRTLESLFRGILILHSFFKAKHGLGVHWSGPVYFPTQFVCIPTPTWILTITWVFPIAEHWGLSLIYEAETSEDDVQNIVDIVFVHGLTGNYETTWTASDFGVFWPRDLLPKSVPCCRVLTYGYNSDLVNHSTFESLLSSARQLLGHLIKHRAQVVRFCWLPQALKWANRGVSRLIEVWSLLDTVWAGSSFRKHYSLPQKLGQESPYPSGCNIGYRIFLEHLITPTQAV